MSCLCEVFANARETSKNGDVLTNHEQCTSVAKIYSDSEMHLLLINRRQNLTISFSWPISVGNGQRQAKILTCVAWHV